MAPPFDAGVDLIRAALGDRAHGDAMPELAALLERFTVAVVAADDESRYIAANSAAVRLTG